MTAQHGRSGADYRTPRRIGPRWWTLRSVCPGRDRIRRAGWRGGASRQSHPPRRVALDRVTQMGAADTFESAHECPVGASRVEHPRPECRARSARRSDYCQVGERLTAPYVPTTARFGARCRGSRSSPSRDRPWSGSRAGRRLSPRTIRGLPGISPPYSVRLPTAVMMGELDGRHWSRLGRRGLIRKRNSTVTDRKKVPNGRPIIQRGRRRTYADGVPIRGPPDLQSAGSGPKSV